MQHETTVGSMTETTTATGPVKDASPLHQHFLRSWLREEKLYLRRLVDVPRGPAHEPDRIALVADAMAHHRAYFAATCELSRRDAALALSPPWLSPYAAAGIWMGGWRPTAAVRLAISITGSVFHMSGLQAERGIIRAEEERIDGEMERVQDRAVSAVVGWTRGCGGEEEAVKEMAEGMGNVVRAAEGLRMEALTKVVELVEPSQAVDFLAAFDVLQLDLHRTDRI